MLVEAAAISEILDRTPKEAFELPTVCTGWSVRDVLAHCSAALTATVSGQFHGFTPDDNQRDVDERKTWALSDVIAELMTSYKTAATAVDAAGGAYDGIALGEWVHGGDIREAIGEPGAYTSPGAEIAVELLADRSALMGRPHVDVALPSGPVEFGAAQPGHEAGSLRTDIETFVRLCGARNPDAARYELIGATTADLVLFS